MLSERVSAFLLYMLQKIYVPVPVRGLVDFLEGDDVRGMPVNKSGDLLQIFSDAVRAVKPLVERKASSMRDIETHDTELLCGVANGWHVVVS